MGVNQTPYTGLSTSERESLETEAVMRLKCVDPDDFELWCDLMWKSTRPHPETTDELLTIFCGDCTNLYEILERKVNRCNRDDWDEIL